MDTGHDGLVDIWRAGWLYHWHDGQMVMWPDVPVGTWRNGMVSMLV